MVLDEATWNKYTPAEQQNAKLNWDWTGILGGTVAPPPPATPAPITLDAAGKWTQGGAVLGDGTITGGAVQRLATQSGQNVNENRMVYTPGMPNTPSTTPSAVPPVVPKPNTPPVVKPNTPPVVKPGGTNPGGTTPGGQVPGTQANFNPSVNGVTTAEALKMFLDDHPQDVWNAAVNNLKERGVAPYMTSWLRRNFQTFYGAWQGMLASQAIQGVLPTGSFSDYLFGVTQSGEVQNSIYRRGLSDYMSDPQTTQTSRQRDYLNSGAAQG